MKHPTILVATNTKSGHKPTGITSDNFILIPAKKTDFLHVDTTPPKRPSEYDRAVQSEYWKFLIILLTYIISKYFKQHALHIENSEFIITTFKEC